jgi:hypothetical protein
MSSSAECLRHAYRCAALAERETDQKNRAIWMQMGMRWLRRADMPHDLLTRKPIAQAVTFKGQPRLNLASQPIEKLTRRAEPQPMQDKPCGASHLKKGHKFLGSKHDHPPKTP